MERDALKDILKESGLVMNHRCIEWSFTIADSKKILAFEDVLRSAPATFRPDVIVQFGNGLCTKRYEHWLKTLTCPV